MQIQLIDLLEYKYFMKGEYMFRQGDKPDYAYYIMYGTVVFLKVNSESYKPGTEP